MRRLNLLALTLALLLPHCTSSTPPKQPPTAHITPASQLAPALAARLAQPIPLDPEVRRGVLDNGLTYYIRVNHKPEKRAELRLAVNAGSVLESEEQRGLAHFVEHMAFNGTENFKKQDLVTYLERIGMRLGPEVNAGTGLDDTVYMLHVPTDDAKTVETAFQILRDWASAVTFDPAEVEKERGVVIEEWRLGRGASGRIRDKQFPVLFHGSRYADRLTIGKKEVLEKAPREQIQKFYRDWYRPELMAVIAVGDFDPARIETLIREQFGRIPRSKKAPARKEFEVPDHKETLTSIVTDPEATGISVVVDFKRPRERYRTLADLRESMVETLYHTMMNMRLGELARTADPPYQAAFAGNSPIVRTKSAYQLFARVNNGGVERALATLLTEAKRVDQYGFTETELARAKTSYLRSIDRAWEERDKQESNRYASQYLGHFLDGYPTISIESRRQLMHELVPGITLGEINALASQWITDTNRVILVSGPEKKEARIPDEKQLLAVFTDTEKLAVTPWVDRVRDEPLVGSAPRPGKIVEETKFEDVGVTRWKLSNGPVVLLKPTDFKNDEVLISGRSPGGESLAPDSAHITTMQAAGIVSRMGAGNFDSTELSKALTGKVASVFPMISELYEGVSGMASPKDLETAFQLLYLRFTAPHRDDKEFAAYLSGMRGQLENQEASPEYWFARRFNEVMTQDHPRRRFPTLEQTKQIDVEQALAFYRERFSDASDFTFTIVGSFDPAVIRPLVEKWIGGLPASGRVEQWRDVGVVRPSGVQKVKVEKGLEPRSRVQLVFHGSGQWSLAEAHQLQSLAELLRIRLREELREEKGGVYGVGVFGGISHYPRQDYSFTVNFSTDPQRVDELVASVLAEIRKLKAEGPSDDYVNRVHEIQKRSLEESRKQNGWWAGQIASMAWNGIDLSEILRDDQRIAAVTKESLRETAKKYLDESQYVLGVLDPEKKAEAKAAAQ